MRTGGDRPQLRGKFVEMPVYQLGICRCQRWGRRLMTRYSIFFRRCQKVVPEKLSLTGNLACDGQLTRRFFGSILRQVENGVITNMTARVSARGAQNSLYQAHIVA